MNEDNHGKIVLSEKLQKEMLEFFLKTSIPRKKKLKEEQKTACSLSDKKTDRSNQNGS